MNGKRILLVDSDEPLLNRFQSVLQEEGHTVETATTGKQALDKAKNSKFDLAILDIKLPDIRGDEVARELKSQDDNTSIVMITGYPSFQDSIDALDIGISEILLKPISPDEIIRIAKLALQNNSEVSPP